ncbi:hypothetical protein D3C72_2299810 [compost metagenome]
MAPSGPRTGKSVLAYEVPKQSDVMLPSVAATASQGLVFGDDSFMRRVRPTPSFTVSYR